ncbi:MAG: dihydrofolate reductase family protein [Chloroflexota bacterium]
MKITVYIATSLDGFIARPDGDIDWLNNPDYVLENGDDMGYGALMQSIDAMVMGSSTFEKVLSFGIEWPYGETTVIVLSSRDLEVPAEIKKTVRLMKGSPAEIVQSLMQDGINHIYLDGGKTVQNFLAAGLVSELIITKIPILLGQGIPLFGPIPQDMHLTHMSTQSYPNGMVQSRYESDQA